MLQAELMGQGVALEDARHVVVRVRGVQAQQQRARDKEEQRIAEETRVQEEKKKAAQEEFDEWKVTWNSLMRTL